PDAESGRDIEAIRHAVRANRRPDEEATLPRDAARAPLAGRRAREENGVADGQPQAEPAGPRGAAQGRPGLLQGARRDRAAARRAELETLKVGCDGLAAQVADVQHKLDGVRHLQQRLAPLATEVNTLKAEIGAAHQRIGSVKFDEAVVVEQEKRFAEPLAASRT